MLLSNSFRLFGINFLIIFIGLISLSSCRTTKPTVSTSVQQIDKVISMQIKSLKAINLEEDLTLADEIMLTYALTAIDENNKVTQVANGSFGVESMKKGQIIPTEKFKPLSLVLPQKGKILASVILTEIEDYQKAQNTVKKINEFGGIGKIPALFISLGEYETPLAVVFASLQAAGIGLKAAEHFDKDDLLGQNTFDLSLTNLSKTQTKYPVQLKFEGENLKNKFHYELSYELIIR